MLHRLSRPSTSCWILTQTQIVFVPMLAILLTVLQNLNIKGRAKPLCPHPFRWTTKTRDVPNYFIWIWISLFVPDVPVPTPYLSLSLGHSIPCLSNPRRMQTYCPLQFDFESILVNVSILQFVSKSLPLPGIPSLMLERKILQIFDLQPSGE